MKTLLALILMLALGLPGTMTAEPSAEKAAAEKVFEARVTKVLAECNRLQPGTTRPAVVAALRDCERLRPGQTRGDILKVMRRDGGFSTAYVHPACNCIKVDVTFIPANQTPRADEQTNDVIRTVSAPYVALAIQD